MNSIDVKISASFGVRKINGVISGYGKSASSRVYKLLLSTCINNTKPNGQIHKANWTREEECSLINKIESASEILRGSGNSANKNKRRKQIRRDIAAKLNSVHGNGRAVEDIREKCTNLKLNAKSKVDASFREARKTGRGTNTAGQVEDGCRLTSITARSLFQQIAVFSAQLQLIEEQRDYYRLKRQRLLEKSL